MYITQNIIYLLCSQGLDLKAAILLSPCNEGALYHEIYVAYNIVSVISPSRDVAFNTVLDVL